MGYGPKYIRIFQPKWANSKQAKQELEFKFMDLYEIVSQVTIP